MAECFLCPVTAFIPALAGIVGQLRGQQGPSLPLSASGTVPDMRALGRQEHRAD